MSRKNYYSQKEAFETNVSTDEDLKESVEEELKIPEKEESTVSKPSKGKIVGAVFVNVRDRVGLGGEVVGVLNMGDDVVIMEDTDANWYKIKTNRLSGYVSKSFCIKEDSDE